MGQNFTSADDNMQVVAELNNADIIANFAETFKANSSDNHNACEQEASPTCTAAEFASAFRVTHCRPDAIEGTGPPHLNKNKSVRFHLS